MERKWNVLQALLWIALSGLIVDAQTQIGQFRELTFSIKPARPSFVPLEPIPLKLTLENRTASRILAHPGLDFSTNYIKISIEKPNGTLVDIGQLSYVGCRCFSKNVEMLPGAKFEKFQVLNFQLDRYFNEVGQYKIKANFMSLDGNQTVISPWTTFNIAQPSGSNFAAYDFLKQQKNLSLFLCCYDNESVQDLKTFINIFPESAYSDYIRYLLVSHYLHQENDEKAKEQLVKLQDNKDFVYAEDVKTKLKQIVSKTRKSN